jgi:hypothetical protein
MITGHTPKQVKIKSILIDAIRGWHKVV